MAACEHGTWHESQCAYCQLARCKALLRLANAALLKRGPIAAQCGHEAMLADLYADLRHAEHSAQQLRRRLAEARDADRTLRLLAKTRRSRDRYKLEVLNLRRALASAQAGRSRKGDR